MTSRDRIHRMFDLALRHFGPQHWWPGETPFEVIVGAILTQNTAWTNVEKAIRNLKQAGMLDAASLRKAPLPVLAAAIRPAGYFNVKARRLKSFLEWFHETCGSSIARLKARPIESLREDLLSVSGIGRETADSILLYALDKPTFVVDAYTARVLRRHALIDESADYDEIKALLEDSQPRDLARFNEFHALFVAVGKYCCTKRIPRCDACPLRSLTPITLEEAAEA
ncbi:MAG: endonuclease III domain-containing protein [Planctomycetes bacterium]|nr:endonuclease III domain-containing protein [Planctomycetota bacterium]